MPHRDQALSPQTLEHAIGTYDAESESVGKYALGGWKVEGAILGESGSLQSVM